MPAHSDWGTITMLFQDDSGGLQVEDPNRQGHFVDATPMTNALVMNVGDLLMRWSNGSRTTYLTYLPSSRNCLFLHLSLISFHTRNPALVPDDQPVSSPRFRDPSSPGRHR